MGLNETMKRMRELLGALSVDLEKGANGNKAAAQRVRTGSIRLEKTAKLYRKESINAEKSGTGPKKPKKAAKANAKASNKASPQPKNKAAKGKQVKAKQAQVKARPKAKALFNSQRKSGMMVKRSTAKIPFKKM